VLKLTAGTFNLTAVVDTVFFIGSHLVALNRSGKLGVWHAVSQNWQVITALFTAHCLWVMVNLLVNDNSHQYDYDHLQNISKN